MKKSLILATSFAMALGVGVAVGAHHMKEVAKKVEADGTTLYCTMAQSWWKTDGAAVGIYAWSGTGEQTVKNADWPGVRMAAVEGKTDMWSYTLTGSYKNVIFTRVNGSGDILDWGAKTKDLTIPTDGKNHFTITSSSAVWGDPGCDGEWSTYPAVASTYSYSLNGGEDVEMTPSGNEVISVSRSFEVGDELTFKKDSAAYAVTAKDDDAYTKVELVDNKLVFVQDYTGVLYLNTSSAKLWAGELDRGYYLNGSFSPEWNVKHALKASEKEGEEGTFEIKGLTVADDAEVKFMQFVNNQKEPNYVNIDGEKLTIGGGIDAELTEGNNLKFNKGGTYDFYLNTTNNNWLTVNDPSYVPPEPEPADDPAEDGYYLVGTESNWKYAGATKLDAGENGNKAQLINYSATAGEQFKVRSRLETVDTWYGWGDSHDQNYVVGESNKQLDIYVNSDGYLWVQEHVEPDEPDEDGYYICGIGGSFKYKDAVKMTETTAGGNVAYYSGLVAEVGDEIRVRSYFDPRLDPQEDVDQWATLGTHDVDYGELHGDNFKFSKAGSYDIYAKYEDGFKFFVSEHVDNFTIEMTAVKFNGKASEGTEAMASQLAYITADFEPQNLEKSGYVMQGVFEEEALETPYTPRKFAANGHLYVKYMKVGFYALSAAGEYKLENADPMMTEGIAETNKAEVLLTVKTNDCYSFVEYKADGTMAGQSGLGDGIPAGLATYESDEFGGHVKFLKDAVVSVYLGNDNKVYLNEGLTAFLTNFISDVGSVCSTLDGPGYNYETYIANLQVAWGRQKVAFNALSDEEQKEIKDAEYGPKAGEDDLSKMINKYYYIVEKYGTSVCEDFIWKQTVTPKVGNNVMFLNNSNNTGLIIIISVSAISVISFAALLMLKKKKRK